MRFRRICQPAFQNGKIFTKHEVPLFYLFICVAYTLSRL